MPTLRLDIDEAQFTQQLIAMLARGGVDLQYAVTTAVKSGISQNLEQLVAAGICLRYRFKNGGQSRILSLKEAVEHNGFDFWYLDIQIDFLPGTEISERDVSRPLGIQWLAIDYGSGVRKTFKFKRTTLKTRERYEIQILHPQVPAKLLGTVLQHFQKECPCSVQHLIPIPVEVWEWRQAFGCLICGRSFLCECFRTAIEKAAETEKRQACCDADEPDREELNRFIDNVYSAQYRPGICHLCTGKPSNLFYCSPMYGSAVKVRYGAYIEKFVIAEGLSPRDAENKVRDILRVPRIGEGWISETQLFRLLELFFSDYELIREACPDWLGNQRLDFFIPALSLAIEYQGEQHFKPVERFGGEATFPETQLRDARKRRLCKENGVRLVYFTYTEDLTVEQVEKKLRRFLVVGQ
ncbi:MAG: hypothetical protein WBV60_05610 [Terriglobales bacterium]